MQLNSQVIDDLVHKKIERKVQLSTNEFNGAFSHLEEYIWLQSSSDFIFLWIHYE